MDRYYYEIYIKDGKQGFSVGVSSPTRLTNDQEIAMLGVEQNKIDFEDINYLQYTRQITAEEYINF